jgi:hypothetical protein
MNERIQKLAVQAHAKDNTLHYYNPEFIEKFAELIVRECAGIYSKIDNGNQHLGTYNYLEALQKHFGVEE